MTPRAAIYARISQDSEREGLGTARQRDDCLSLCERRGWSVAGVYIDDDISAAGAKRARPGYDAMLASVKAGEIDVIVAYSNSRLSRRPAEWIALINLANDGTVEIATVVSGQHDLTTADGRAVALTVAVWDAAEAERTSERVKRKLLENAREGRKKQGRWRMFGYDRQMNQISEEAAAVKEAFKRKAAGESLTAIALSFNDRGLTTVTGRAFDASAITKMIRRPDYMGKVAHNGIIIGDASFEGLVDAAVWQAANDQTEARNRRGKNARRGLLSGFMVCGNCHTKMKRGASDGMHTYRCPGKTVSGSCGSCSITGPKTDEAVFNAVWRHEQDAQREQPPTPVESDRDWRAEESAIAKEVADLKAFRESGKIGLADYVDELDALRKRQAALAKEEAAAVVHDLGVLQLMNNWEEWSLSAQRLWLDKYVSYVVVEKHNPKLPTKGYKPERLIVHYEDGRIERLSGDKTVLDRIDTRGSKKKTPSG
jgi:site-specific DNA recombinase